MEFRKGMRLPDARISSVGGISTALSDFRGRKLLIYGWASWDSSRDALGLLQKFYAKHHSEGFDVASIAFDAVGPAAPMRYLRAADARFHMLIDATCTLTRRWDVRRVPFTLLLDEERTVLLSASTPDEEFLSEVAAALKKKAAVKAVDAPAPADPSKQYQVEILMQACTNFLGRQRKDDAVNALKQALALDPENAILRTQILSVDHPEKFYEGKIDAEWVKSQLGNGSRKRR